MPELDWYTSDEIPDRANTLAPRAYEKHPLTGYAIKIPTLPDQPQVITTVTLVGNTIIADNSEDLLITVTEVVTHIDASYDQLNRLWCAYIEGGSGKLFWYDAALAAYTTFEFGTCDVLYLFMDDIRYYAGATTGSVVFLIYERDRIIYYRTQDDRFLIEYILAPLLEGEKVVGAGMNEKYRIQVVLQRNAVNAEPSLGDTLVYAYVINDVPVMINQDVVITEVINEYNNSP